MKLPRRPRRRTTGERPTANAGSLPGPMPTFGSSAEAAIPPVAELAPGWAAIDAALAPHYGDEPARHVGFTPPAAFSNNLQGCSAYAADGHWMFVTYGLSDLFGSKPSEEPVPPEEPGRSGHGFELTMRIPRDPDSTPPDWPFAMLNELGKQVRSRGVPIKPGDRVDLRAPVTGHPQTDGPPSALTVFAFRDDPVLGAIDTPQGSVRFVQVVGLTAAEKAEMATSGTDVVLTQLGWGNPLLVLDPARS